MSEQKITRTVVVTDPAGLHARPAVGIAECVRKHQSRVVLKNEYNVAEGTDVLQLMSMVAACGSSIELEATGPDAAETLDALEPYFTGHW